VAFLIKPRTNSFADKTHSTFSVNQVTFRYFDERFVILQNYCLWEDKNYSWNLKDLVISSGSNHILIKRKSALSPVLFKTTVGAIGNNKEV